MKPAAFTFETTDPDEAHAFIHAMYAHNTIRISGDAAGFRLRHRQVSCGPLSLATAANSMATQYDLQPLGGILVMRILAGRAERTTMGHTARAGPGDVLLLARPDEPHTLSCADVRVQVIWIDANALTSVAGVAPRFTGLEPINPVQARNWRRTLDYTVASLRGASLNDLVIGSAVSLLAAATLTTFANTGTDEITRPHDATRAAMHRAISAMENLTTCALSDLTDAARIDIDALELAFTRHAGTTLAEYHLQVRLDRVHQDLLYIDPHTTTHPHTTPGPSDPDAPQNTNTLDPNDVPAIARRAGFLDLTRFAADYRTAFGCTPESTLNPDADAVTAS